MIALTKTPKVASTPKVDLTDLAGIVIQATAWTGLLVAGVAMLGRCTFTTVAWALRDDAAAPLSGVTIPPGYRNWKLVSVAHEPGDSDLRVILANDTAIASYREGRSAFPDGAIIARLAWPHVSSAGNSRVWGREQSFGSATNVQFMVKDSSRYAATGGWGYAQFQGGKPADAAVHRTCAGCHAKAADAVFTRYSR
jgi:hypothetical protein